MPVLVIVKRFLLFGLLLLSVSSYAANFEIQSANITKIGNGYILNAQIKYPLTARIEEALANGVPITFLQQLKLEETTTLLGDYWAWQDTLWIITLRYELRYHALSKQYVLLALDTHHRRSFLTLESALTALGTIEALNLPPEHLSDLEDLSLQLRSKLDLYALPTPMRPGALISSKWKLASPWTTIAWP